MQFQDGRAEAVARYGRFDTAGKMVLNDNKDITNVLPDDQLVSTIRDTMDDVINLLSKHCGPDSEYAMIVTGSGNADFEPNIFTKDGIKILSQLEYVSPIQTYVKELIAYIGRRVDSVAKDGTTTSMLISAVFLKRMMDIVEQATPETSLSTREWDEVYTNISRAFMQEVIHAQPSRSHSNKVVWTLEDIVEYGFREDDAAGIVAYTQALSSSGMNHVLAKVNWELFKNTPKELWNRITMTQSTIETEDTYKVRYQESQYKIMANMMTEIRNVDLGTRYVEEDVLCFVYPDAISGGTVVLDRVINLLDEIPESQPMAIVAQEVDGHLVQYIEKLNRTRTKPVTVYTNLEKTKYGSDSWDLMAINAMAGVYSYTDRDEALDSINTDRHCFITKRLEMNYNHLEFFDFYPVEIEDSNIHPYYLDPEKFIPYTELLSSLNTVIDRDITAHVHNPQLVENAYRVISQMVCRRVPQLVIGGSTHENIANMAVAQDVIGATMSSIEHGFVFGGLLSVLLRAEDILDIQYTNHTEAHKLVMEVMFICMELVINTVYKPDSLKSVDDTSAYDYIQRAYRGKDYTSSYINANVYRNITNHRKSWKSDSESIEEIYKWTITDYSSYLDKFKHDDMYVQGDHPSEDLETLGYPPMQPVKLYSELFNRIGELLLKVMKTKTIMVPGGVFLNEE